MVVAVVFAVVTDANNNINGVDVDVVVGVTTAVAVVAAVVAVIIEFEYSGSIGAIFAVLLRERKVGDASQKITPLRASIASQFLKK